ncbi:hypothetical protein ASZ90_013223 [hydrocarbon metagenome]|uniref:Uncharacterized protein n=1 Tax=hydrocarbon metagenome TaxID=938273 RepID=A0A0W8F880_9ZZZZ
MDAFIGQDGADGLADLGRVYDQGLSLRHLFWCIVKHYSSASRVGL